MDGFFDRLNINNPKDNLSSDKEAGAWTGRSQQPAELHLPEVADTDHPGTLRAGEILEVSRRGWERPRICRGDSSNSSGAAQSLPELPPNRCVLKRIAVPDKSSLSVVEDEIAIIKALQGSANIVEFYASSIRPLPKSQGGYEAFILMEYCSKGTLVELMRLREGSMLTEPEILYFFHEICMLHFTSGLQQLFIAILSEQRLKLCDFGSSTTQQIAPGSVISVARAQVLEDELARCTTLQYRAPEMLDLFQRRGLTEKLALDIWALGIILYKLCYFKTPFEAEGPLAILNCRYCFPPTPIYSPPLLQLIKRMLQENPAQRPPIQKIIIEICRLRGVQPTISEPPPEMPIEAKSSTEDAPPAPVLAQVDQRSDSLFKLEAIVPMRRGRPTRQNKTIPFVPVSADPFERIVAGLELQKPPESDSPWEVLPPKLNQGGTFWDNTPVTGDSKDPPKVPSRKNNPRVDLPHANPDGLFATSPQTKLSPFLLPSLLVIKLTNLRLKLDLS
ncbi:Ark- serine/threonine protein kinase, partial [Massospora cicadina]